MMLANLCVCDSGGKRWRYRPKNIEAPERARCWKSFAERYCQSVSRVVLRFPRPALSKSQPRPSIGRSMPHFSAAISDRVRAYSAILSPKLSSHKHRR